MSTATIDTLAIVKRLKEAGFSEPQAEAVTGILRDARDADLSQLATKTDLQLLEQRLTIKMGGLIAVAVALVATLVRPL